MLLSCKLFCLLPNLQCLRYINLSEWFLKTYGQKQESITSDDISIEFQTHHSSQVARQRVTLNLNK